MQYGEDFTIEPLPKKCQGHKLKPSLITENSMEPNEALRQYWRIRQKECRARKKERESQQ